MLLRCTALLLSLAFAGAQVLADYCTVSCEAAHTHDAAAASPHANHHHEPTVLFSISQPPHSCGHSHNGIVGVTARSDEASARDLAPAGAVMPASPITAPGWISAHIIHDSKSPPGDALRSFATPIRI